MGKENKDRALKMSLIRYFISRNIYPHLEVNVLSKQRISNKPKLVTDVDVVGLYPDSFGQFELVLGDCKTLSGVSPISRTLWLKGLMDYTGAIRGMIILSKEVEKEHQLTASDLNIQLLSDNDFHIYSRHTTDTTVRILSAIANQKAWDRYFETSQRYTTLRPLQDFSDTGFWNETSPANRFRQILYNLRKYRGELNPEREQHLGFVLNLYSLAAIAFNDIINKIFNRYLLPNNFEELDNDLKVMLWGGIENYEYYNELRKRVQVESTGTGDLTLPEWSRFIEFVRTVLEHPRELNFVPLLLKETAFKFFAEPNTYDYGQYLSKASQYNGTFSIRLSDYLTKAAGLPMEFHAAFEKSIYEVMS